MRLLATANGASVYHATHDRLVDVVPECDMICVDTPYSAKTHNGHGTLARWGKGVPPSYDGGDRREIDYQHWSPRQIRDFVNLWSPRCRGWFCSITDSILAPVWRAYLGRAGRYAFAPIPLVVSGSTVRMTGDGPSSWTAWLVVARWSTPEMLRWGTLPGAYVLPDGQKRDLPIVGGKQPWIVQRIVEDYSRPGDLVVDPCCGAGTTAIAAIRASGGARRAVVGDVDEKHAALAAQWIQNPHRAAPGMPDDRPTPQITLFGGVS